MTYYDTPTINETSSILETFKFINTNTTEGLFFPLMLLVIWMVSFMTLKGYSNSRAFTFASFFCAFLSIIMAVLDLIGARWMYLSIFMTLIGFVWLKLESSPRF